VVVKTRDEAEKMIAAGLARDFSDDQLRIDAIAGSLLGLYPRDIDLRSEYLRLMRSEVAGFYDPAGMQMVLVEGVYVRSGFWSRATSVLAGRDLVGEILLAHELTHALQDQHFELDKNLKALRGNSDRMLAYKAVAEGDAMLAGFGFVAGKLDAETAEMLASRIAGLPEHFASMARDTPAALSDPLIFQYVDGTRFVAEAYRRGGWKAVDALYASPPESTQQVMHPQLYFDRPSPPVGIEVSGFEETLDGWKVADQDTYGELMIRVILRRHYGRNAPELAIGRRWRGDRAVVVRNGDEVGVLWLLVFADERSAARFAAMYATLLDRRVGPRTPHEVEYRGDLVLAVAGPPALRFQELAPSIFARSKIDRPPAPPDESQLLRAAFSSEDSSCAP
jgi:hypothetical protein